MMIKNNKKFTYEEVYRFFKNQGCELRSREYKNSKEKLKYLCICGEEDEKTFSHFKRGQRCRRCAIKNNADKQRKSNNEIINLLSAHVFELLDDNYKSSSTPIKMKCSCGKDIYKSLSTFKQYPKCTCKNKNIPTQKGKRYTEQELIFIFWKYFDEYGYYPLAKSFNKNKEYPSSLSYTRRWGSWENFLNHIGILGEGGWYKCDEEVLKNKYATHDKDDIVNSLMIKRSWSSIQHKANELGIKRSHEAKYQTKKYTDGELIEILKNYYNKHSEIPTGSVFTENENCPSQNVYRHRFGSWNRALELAGLTPKKQTVKLSENELNDMKELYLSGIACTTIAKLYGIKDESGVYYRLRKMGVSVKTNQWSEQHIENLKTYYPNESWDVLLEILKPFNKDDIITKAYKLRIKREGNEYSQEEIDTLISNYGKVTFNEIMNLLPNRSGSSIMTKANKLGLNMRHKWTDSEIKKLCKLYPYYTNEELIKFFPNRTLTSISSMATMKLNLSKDTDHLRERYYEKGKIELLKILVDFSKEIGRTPTSEELDSNPNTPSHSSYHRFFGSYTDACKEAGLEPNVSIFGKSYHYISENGDVCLSSKELEITNLLIRNGISFEKEVLYKDILGEAIESMIRTDWLINKEVIVEYFGMPEKEYYKKRMIEKINLCKEHNFKLIPLLPCDLKNSYEGLTDKFSEYGINISV